MLDPETEEKMMKKAARNTLSVRPGPKPREFEILGRNSPCSHVRKHTMGAGEVINRALIKSELEARIQKEFDELEARVKSGEIKREHFQVLEPRIRSGQVTRENFKAHLDLILAGQLAHHEANHLPI